jgi:hypothetical protein
MIHNGQVSLVDRPTLFGSDYKGAEIISGAESARIIDQINRGQVVENIRGVSQSEKDQIQFMVADAIDNTFRRYTREQTNELKRALKGKQIDSRYEASRNKFS